MKPRFPKRGVYSGRLAFNPDTNFHVSADGRHVVTTDGGRTWRYAKRGDLSHQQRYHQRYAVVNSTAAHLLELAAEHGRETAEQMMREQHPHHFAVSDYDPHVNGLRFDTDELAAGVTSHTDAWKEQL